MIIVMQNPSWISMNISIKNFKNTISYPEPSSLLMFKNPKIEEYENTTHEKKPETKMPTVYSDIPHIMPSVTKKIHKKRTEIKTYDQKHLIAKEWLENKTTKNKKLICEKHHISESTLYNWVKEYQKKESTPPGVDADSTTF